MIVDGDVSPIAAMWLVGISSAGGLLRELSVPEDAMSCWRRVKHPSVRTKRHASCARATTPRNPTTRVSGIAPNANAAAPTAATEIPEVISKPPLRGKGPNCGTNLYRPSA